MDIEQTIRNYLPNVIHLSLATSRDNKPWVCEVHYAYDQELNLYFRSKPTRRHSLEIAENSRVAGNIVEQHGLDDDPRGVYFEGIAELLNDVNDQHPAYLTYCERFGTEVDILDEARTENGHKFYRISVNTFYLFDSRESDPSRKYELPWKQ